MSGIALSAIMKLMPRVHFIRIRYQPTGADLKVVSIAAFYGCQGDDSSWTIQPDYTVKAPWEIPDIILGL